MKCLYCEKEAEKYCTLCYACREKLPHAKALAEVLKELRQAYKQQEKTKKSQYPEIAKQNNKSP